ncbi:MAG: carboxylesterase/lipase family protein [Bacteroidales bacterium]|nr:carboxylesterase/lipase family protein [Bacteroidales bacterium]
MKKLFLIASAAVLASCASNVSVSSDYVEVPQFGKGIAEVKTQQGTVAGYIEDGTYIYKGIKYAVAERFCPPTDPPSWEGVKPTRAFGSTAMQASHEISSDIDEFAYQWTDGYFSEDCLHLNIWTPGINDGKKRPVLFWIHGGGYSAGSGQQLPAYDGRNISKRGDVVFVTVNHRLNILGFLDLSAYGEKYKYSGNVGMLDLVAALKWVHNNIEAFGGDPGNVTIMGQSGGGGKVSNLLVMPSAKGLFHKACIQSGSSLSGQTSEQSRATGKAIVEASGLKIDDFVKLPYSKLTEIVGAGGAFRLSPTVDGEVIPMQIEEALNHGASKDIPLMVGSNFNEFSTSPDNTGMTEEQAIKALDSMYNGKGSEFVSLFRKTYPEMEPRDMVEIDTRSRPGAIRQALVKSAQGGAPVYLYQFKYMSPAQDGIFRCPHNMEIAFFFDNVARQYGFTGGTPEGQQLGHDMCDARISFARTGVPSSKGLPEWKPFSQDSRITMVFDVKSECLEGHDKDLVEFISANAVPMTGFPRR